LIIRTLSTPRSQFGNIIVQRVILDILAYVERLRENTTPPLSPYPMGYSKISIPRGTLSTREGE